MIETIKRIVADMLNLQAKTQYGTITAYNPNDYTVKVLLQPEGVETGWIPLTAPWSGNGLGAVFGPVLGTDCRVDFAGGIPEAAMAGARFFNANNPPPVVQSGQAAIVDGAGSYVRLNNDGTITISAAGAATLDAPGGLTINANTTINGNEQVNGNVQASQQISDLNGAHGSISSLRTAYDDHTHSGVQTGTGTTSGPSATV